MIKADPDQEVETTEEENRILDLGTIGDLQVHHDRLKIPMVQYYQKIQVSILLIRYLAFNNLLYFFR